MNEERIRQAIEARQLSARSVAAMSGVSVTTVCRIINKKGEAKLSSLEKIYIGLNLKDAPLSDTEATIEAKFANAANLVKRLQALFESESD